MATITAVRLVRDFKYGPRDWRKDPEEAFQKTKQTLTRNYVVDGQLVKAVVRESGFGNQAASVTAFPFADSSFRAKPEDSFQPLKTTVSTFEAYGDRAHIVSIVSFDPLTGEVSRNTSIADGDVPLAPTVRSILSSLQSRTILASIEDNCGTIDSRTDISSQWAQSITDASTMIKRRVQRETAIVRRFTHAANPLMKLGDTLRLVSERRGLDALHILVQRTISVDENGAGNETLTTEYWTR
jgi:hypothetical protein